MTSLTILGLLFCYILYQSYHYDNIFQIPLYISVGIVWTIVFVKKYRFRELNNLPKSNLKTAAIFSILINLGVLAYYELKINSPTLIKAQIFGGFADFKKNGEYVIVSGPWASREYFYGNYELTDSIIITDRSSFDDVLTTNRFLIKTAHLLDSSYLIQIDNLGKEIQRQYNTQNHRLKIIVDERLNGR